MEKFKNLDEYDLNLASVFNMVPGHAYLKDKMGRYLWCNDQQVKSFNLSSQNEVIGKTDHEIIADKETADIYRKTDLEVMKYGISVTAEEPANLQDNTKVFYLSKKSPLYDKNGKIVGIIGSSFDLSEQKKLITAKEQNEKTLEDIISLIPGHIYWKDRNGFYLGCNNTQAKNLGLKDRNDIIGKTDFDLTKDQKLAQIFRENDLQVINAGEGITVEETVMINGQPVNMLSEKVPLKNKNGIIFGMVGISVDVTELKNTKTKLKIAEERLSGMTSVGASIAHELRTPLAAIELGVAGIKQYLPTLIDGYTKAKQHNLKVDPIRPDHYDILTSVLDNIEAETNYSNTIINMILMNIRQNKITTKNFKTVDIHHCVEEAIRRYPFKDGELAKVHWDDRHHFLFQGDQVMMVHILFNLLKNALYFIEAEGKGDIAIWGEEKGNFNVLYFKDTAKGIPEAAMSSLFEKFYTTTTNGTGLGLAFCKTIMSSFGGDILCESTYGEYTTFILHFPKITD